MKLKQDDLMALYGGFCRSEAQKYAGWADADDLYSAAILGLFEAYSRADHDMLDKLSADEGRAVFLGLAAPYVRDEVRAQAALSGYAMSGHARTMFDVGVPERVSMEIAELAANTDGEGSDGYLIDTLFGLLDEFDEKDSREVTVFYGAYIHGASDESIGELLGLSQPQVHAIRTDMLRKLRKAYSDHA